MLHEIMTLELLDDFCEHLGGGAHNDIPFLASCCPRNLILRDLHDAGRERVGSCVDVDSCARESHPAAKRLEFLLGSILDIFEQSLDAVGTACCPFLDRQGTSSRFRNKYIALVPAYLTFYKLGAGK